MMGNHKGQGAAVPPRRTERAGAKCQVFHGHGTRGKRDVQAAPLK